MLYLRNKMTGEIVPVEAGTEEFIAMKAQVDPNGRPKFEQTGEHHVAAVMARAEAGTLTDHDVGSESAIGDLRYEEEVAPEEANDLNLTAAEVESGLTPELKARHKAGVMSSTLEANRAAQSAAAGRILPEVGSDDDWDPEMTKAQLSDWAGKYNVDISGAKSKADIVGKLEEFDETRDDDDVQVADVAPAEPVEPGSGVPEEAPSPLTAGEEASGLTADDKSEEASS